MENFNDYKRGNSRKFLISPRLKQLKEDFIKSGGKFEKYKIGEYFYVKGNPQLNKESFVFSESSTYPYFTRTAFNNGILGYVDYLDEEHKIKGNSLAVGMIAMQFFYMEHDFYAGQFTKTVYPKFEKFNSKIAQYFISMFNKHQDLLKGVLVRDFESTFVNSYIELPVQNSEISFQYMENYISELEEERISELEKYLKVTGLDNYKLSESEKNTIKKLNSKDFKTQKFKLGEGDNRLFDITTTKKKFNANSIKFGGKYPYVARSSVNNGIRGYITEDEKYLNETNTISFGQDTATMFYQEQPYFTGDKIKIMTFREKTLDKNLACYLIATMKRAFQNFSWGQSSFNENILKNIEIELPVIDKNKIDYDFIEKFITAQHKLAIKNLVDWRNKQINATKQVVNNV